MTARPALPLLLGGATSALLLAGALMFQYVGGLPPCEMCHWQRWPHIAAVVLAVLGGQLLARGAGGLARLAGLGVGLSLLTTGGLGVFHVGVEQRWWEGITRCAAGGSATDVSDIMAQVMAAPLVRCDAIPWSLFGVSMAGYNALISLGVGAIVLWLSLKSRP